MFLFMYVNVFVEVCCYFVKVSCCFCYYRCFLLRYVDVFVEVVVLLG